MPPHVRSVTYSFRGSASVSPAFPGTNVDLMRDPPKASDGFATCKSLLARLQQAQRDSAKRAEEAAEKEQAAVPLRSQLSHRAESESEGRTNEAPHQSRANKFFDAESRATTTTEGSPASRSPSRPPRSATTLSPREPPPGRKLRPYLPTPGTFDLGGAMAHWRERDSVPLRTSRNTPAGSYTQPATPPEAPPRREAEVTSGAAIVPHPAPTKRAFASDAPRLRSFSRG